MEGSVVWADLCANPKGSDFVDLCFFACSWPSQCPHQLSGCFLLARSRSPARLRSSLPLLPLHLNGFRSKLFGEDDHRLENHRKPFLVWPTLICPFLFWGSESSVKAQVVRDGLRWNMQGAHHTRDDDGLFERGTFSRGHFLSAILRPDVSTKT